MTESSNPQYEIQVILPIAIPTAYSYSHPQPIPKGCRVLVPLGKKTKVGLVIAHNPFEPESKTNKRPLKPIEEVIDDESLLPSKLIELLDWMTNYYHYWQGETWHSALPTHFWKPPSNRKTRTTNPLPTAEPQPTNLVKLNTEQQQVIDSVTQASEQYHCFLLHGITGSGKTEVYLNLAQHTIEQGNQVLILVPEISLTKQNIQRIQQRFSQVALYHSGLTPAQRYASWNAVRTNQAQILLGTRSAVFAPFQRLGLIIIDEEHDDSYKQIDRLRYHARDVAVMRCYLENIKILLGSATPSLETLHNVTEKRYQQLNLTERAGNAIMPKIRFIDMRKRNTPLSDKLIEAIEQRLAEKQQTLLFLNRRGYSPVLFCRSCGWVANCIHCERSATYYQHKHRLHCHLCDWLINAPTTCEACQSNDLSTIGEGTEQIENLLRQHFPEAIVERLDRDRTATKGELNKILQRAHDQEIDILIGTQMLSKGHDLPNVTLVGIINTDAGLLSPYYRSEEKLMQLLTQVSGRSGRSEKQGEVIIQTHYPQHPLLQNLFHYGYLHCAKEILVQRQQARLPPQHHQILFRVEATKPEKGQQFIEKTYTIFNQAIPPVAQWCQLYPIVPANIAKVSHYHRLQFIIQSNNRQALQHLLQQTMPQIRNLTRPHELRWSLDLNPLEN